MGQGMREEEVEEEGQGWNGRHICGNDQEERAGIAVGNWDRKAFRVWLMQPDVWNGSRGIKEEEEEEEEKNIVVWNYGGINYLLAICRCKKEGQMGNDLEKSFELVTTLVFASSRYA